MQRVVAGFLLLLAGMALSVHLGALDRAWPLNVLGSSALWLPGGLLLLEPALERRVGRWLGRTS